MSDASVVSESPPDVLSADSGPSGALVREGLSVTIRRVAIPAVIANLLMTAFHNVDTYWIGRHLGATALAAATSSVFWIWLVISIAELVSIGAGSIVARRYGERRPEEAARTAGEGIWLALVLGVLVAIILPLMLPQLFELMNLEGETARVGQQYLGTYLRGMPLIFGFFAVDAAFRASGDTRTPLVILAVSTILAMILDPILILGLYGAPALGVQGAALATLVPRGLACVFGWIVLRRRTLVRMVRPRLAVLANIARIGGPTAATGVAFSAIYVLLTRTTTEFGTPALAALGVGFRIESFVYLFSVGLGAAVAAIVGQSLGAGMVGRARKAGWLGVALATIPGAVMAVIMIVWPERIASIFTSDVLVVEEASRYLRIAAASQLFLGAEIVLEGALGGAGYTLVPMVVSMSITASRIPLAAWSAALWGTTGLWWTLALTATARGIAMACIWQSRGWEGTRSGGGQKFDDVS
ncbi:MAG: MATE family efflux transporter [Phycisphaerae bacterium]|nr:MATE family efflux transporter [Gemmatimonadaceae bacterium]